MKESAMIFSLIDLKSGWLSVLNLMAIIQVYVWLIDAEKFKNWFKARQPD